MAVVTKRIRPFTALTMRSRDSGGWGVQCCGGAEGGGAGQRREW